MSSNFDVVRNKVLPQRQHSKEEVERLFGRNSSPKLANQVIKENYEYYQSVKRQAIADGILDEPRRHPLETAIRAHAANNTPRQLSDNDIRATAQFSRQECLAYLHGKGDGNSDNLGNMQKNDFAKYEIFRRACVAHDLLAERQAQPEKQKPLTEQLNEPDGMILVGDALRQKLNLPEGYRCPPERISQLIEIAVELELTKQQNERDAKLKAEASAVSVEGDK